MPQDALHVPRGPHPGEFRQPVRLPAGEIVDLRLLRPEDADALGRYFLSLSAATRRVYAPHPFDRETAAQLCAELDPAASMRWIAVADSESTPCIVAYIIVRLTPGAEMQRYANHGVDLDPASTCYLAPSVADAYQGCGVGRALMHPILDWLRQMGFRQLVLSGGVRAENIRATRFYSRLGFRRVGGFQTTGEVDNHDMVLELCESTATTPTHPQGSPA